MALTMSTFPQPILDVLRAHPERTALEHGSRSISNGDLLVMISRLASAMRSAGLGRRSGVAIAASLSPEAFAANLAANALGCRVVGVRPGWSAPLLASVIGDGIDAVVVDSTTATPQLVELAAGTRLLSLGSAATALDLLACKDDGAPIAAQALPDDIARLNFTSGSTGQPKGCARTYRAFGLAYRPERWAPALAQLLSNFDRFLVFGSWSMPVMLTFAGRTLMIGGTVILPGDDARLPLLPYAIEQYRLTATLSTVPWLHQMLDALRKDTVDLRTLRALVVSGSPANERLLADAVAQLGSVVWQGYGQAESEMIALLAPDDFAQAREAALTSVGRPLPTIEISLRDAEGNEVPPGEIGEIFVRSPHMMMRYWDNPRETDAVLRDGWLDTRDLGYIDRHGLLHLAGRSRDVIMVHGETCYAEAIERSLASHPDVDQAYVVGTPDAETGEAIHAFIVARIGRTPDPNALAALVRAQLTENSVPNTISIIDAAPIAASGKPDKRALQSRAEASSSVFARANAA